MHTWDHACINSRVEVHVRCVEGALGLGGHVVIGVVRLVARFHHAYAIPSVEFFLLGIVVQIVHTVVRLYSVIVNFICNQILAHLHRENGSFEMLSFHTQTPTHTQIINIIIIII